MSADGADARRRRIKRLQAGPERLRSRSQRLRLRSWSLFLGSGDSASPSRPEPAFDITKAVRRIIGTRNEQPQPHIVLPHLVSLVLHAPARVLSYTLTEDIQSFNASSYDVFIRCFIYFFLSSFSLGIYIGKNYNTQACITRFDLYFRTLHRGN